MWKSRASPTGYNPPQPPLTGRERILSAGVVVLLIAGGWLVGRTLLAVGVPLDWAYTIPGVGFAVWALAWTTLVHNATLPTPMSIWARRVLSAVALLAAVAALYGALTL